MFRNSKLVQRPKTRNAEKGRKDTREVAGEDCMEKHNGSKAEAFEVAVARMRRIVCARLGHGTTAVVDEFLTERRVAAEIENRD
ncbi:hypothetical protein [Azospirillum halopraeferens]|uniref:hypothetical protein n=1 Tax=Azospirillum halopraeferens TaxID=34010 RepID=UPI0012EBC064|nr:hypothetical protein [Azospirillum halopraeferens]